MARSMCVISGLAVTLALPPTATSAVREVKSGVMSFTIAEEFVDFLALAGAPIVAMNSTAEPADGFDMGLVVLDSSTFSINVADGVFAGFRDSHLDTQGGFGVAPVGFPDVVNFDAFAVVWDAEHEPEPFYMRGHISILEIVASFGDFTLDQVIYDENTGRLIVLEIEMRVSDELASDVFGFPPLAGTPLARARIDLTMAVPDGDADDDLDVDLADYTLLPGCTTGPGGEIQPASCRTFDLEEDGDVDLTDFGLFQAGFTGALSVNPSQVLITSDGIVDAAVEVTPLDFFEHGAGLTPFLRTYPGDSSITLSAALESGGRFFERWVVGGAEGDVGEPAAGVILSEDMTATARYADVVIYVHPMPPPDLCEGGAVTLSVTAVGNDLEFEWFRDNEPVAGAVTDTLTIDPVFPSDSGSYVVVVGNDLATITSEAVDLSVTPGEPVISVQPQGVDVCPGGAVFLLVSAAGGTLEFQWTKDGEEIPGATGPFFAIGMASPEDSGVYVVQISNVCGTVFSTEAVVDVDVSHCP